MLLNILVIVRVIRYFFKYFNLICAKQNYVYPKKHCIVSKTKRYSAFSVPEKEKNFMTAHSPFNYLKEYSHFTSVPEMDKHVEMHMQTKCNDLKQSAREVLHAIAGHALDFVGAAHLKAETIANEIGMSTKSVYRAVKDLVGLGIVLKENRPKMNGIKGANVYSILPCVRSNVPSETSHRANDETPCDTKVEVLKIEPVSLNLLITNKSLKDTNITDVPDKNKSLKIGLLNKVPQVIAKAISPFMDDADEIFEMVGTIFNAKKKADKSIQIEAHEDEYYKAIVSVFESQKRAARKEKPFNVFAVMYRAIEKLTKSIVCPESKKAPQVMPDDNIKPLQTKELIQQWMIDAEADPTRKAQLQATKDLQEQQSLITRSKERVPDWMLKRSGATVQVPQSNSVDDDAAFFEQAQKAFRERLATS